MCADFPHMTTLLELPDEFWGLYALRRDPLFRKIPLNKIPEYIRCSMECGILEARKEKDHSKAPDIKAQIEGCGLKLLCDSEENGGHQIIFAQFVEPDEITLSLDAQKRMEALGCWEQLFPEASFEDILLSHEFFHYLESRKGSSIYTRTEKIELWRKPFSNRSCITALSEIAAMAFAKEYQNLSFCPFALDVLMLYLYDKDGAFALYEKIMEEWKLWNGAGKSVWNQERRKGA